MKILKTIEPQDGAATTVVDVLKRSRDLLSDEGRWVQGSMMCPIKHADNHMSDDEDWTFEASHDERERVVDEIMRDGLCGDGWGVCAVGAVSLFAGLNVLYEDESERFNPKKREFEPFTGRFTGTLVNENGSIASWAEVNGIDVPAERVAVYKQAVDVLNQVSRDLAEYPDWYTDEDHALSNVTVWLMNDGGSFIPQGSADDPHGFVLSIFDKAIEQAEKVGV